MKLTNVVASAILGFSALTSGHPGEVEQRNEAHEIEKREYKMNARRGLESCAEKLERRGVNARAQVRTHSL
jgi:hypothetical protein